ncbi:MAG: hypothetical protein ACPHAS_01935 [Synechococcus sp.]
MLQRQVKTNTFGRDDWSECTRSTIWRQAIDQLDRKRVVYEQDTAAYREVFYLDKDIYDLVGVKCPEVPVPTYGSNRQALEVPSDEDLIECFPQCVHDLRASLADECDFGVELIRLAVTEGCASSQLNQERR